MVKTFNEVQMADPWGWCMGVIEKYEISSRMISEATDTPRSTVRSLFNGNNTSPRYELLCKLTQLCIDLENGGGYFPKQKTKEAIADAKEKAKEAKVAPKQPSTIEDFL